MKIVLSRYAAKIVTVLSTMKIIAAAPDGAPPQRIGDKKF
jgi:hypothetical protein